MFWFFRANRFYFIDISRGGAQPNISQSVIGNTDFPIVEDKLQKNIALFLSNLEQTKEADYSLIPPDLCKPVKLAFDYLSCLQKLEYENKNQEKYVSQLKQAVLQEAIAGQLTAEWRTQNPMQKGNPDTDAAALLTKIKAEKQQLITDGKLKKEKPLAEIAINEIPFSLPDSWVWCRLSEMCTKITDGFHNTPKKRSSGQMYISATHIREHGINWDKCLYIDKEEHQLLFKKTFPQKGEILITNRGAGCGTPAIIDIDKEFSFQNAALIGFNQSLLSSKFIFNFILKMRADIMINFVNGGLQPMLSNVVLGTIPFPLPPLAEQKAIVEKCDRLMNIIDQLEQQIKHRKQLAEDLMQTVLREAFE